MTLESALRLRNGQKLVFTNGVFDLLHAGHVRYLAQAAELGDLLIVGVNNDASVRRLQKGPERPLNRLEDRIAVLEGLRAVSGAVAFAEDTPERLIEVLRPEVHVKGGDYTEDMLPEAKIVRAYGGDVLILPTLEGRSTTSLVAKIRANETAGPSR
jgi:rfaE bifunctional protein nucleotidyltransferase chain/domain